MKKIWWIYFLSDFIVWYHPNHYDQTIQILDVEWSELERLELVMKKNQK